MGEPVRLSGGGGASFHRPVGSEEKALRGGGHLLPQFGTRLNR
jgi:hypothetical protein